MRFLRIGLENLQHHDCFQLVNAIAQYKIIAAVLKIIFSSFVFHRHFYYFGGENYIMTEKIRAANFQLDKKLENSQRYQHHTNLCKYTKRDSNAYW